MRLVGTVGEIIKINVYIIYETIKDINFLIELKTKKLLTKTENNIILILKKISLTADNRLGYFD